MCHEIGRRPQFNVDAEFNRESHSLAAGFALGMVLLGKGAVGSPADTVLIEKLFSFVEGGPSHATVENQSLHRLKETGMINTDVTCPAALMALTLIFLKSGNKLVFDRLAIPNSTVGHFHYLPIIIN